MSRIIGILALLLVAGLVAWLVAFINQGLSSRIEKGPLRPGEMRVILAPDYSLVDREAIDEPTMSRVRDVLERRITSLGLTVAEMRLRPESRILMRFQDVSDSQRVLEGLTTPGRLEFRHLANVTSDRNPRARYRMSEIAADPTKGTVARYTFRENLPGGKQVPVEQVIKESALILRGDALQPTSRAVIAGNAQPQVSFDFKSEGARIFADFTSANVGEILALVLDDAIISAPVIRSPITEGSGVIEGGFANMDEARSLAGLLNSGQLPIPLKTAAVQYGPPS